MMRSISVLGLLLLSTAGVAAPSAPPQAQDDCPKLILACPDTVEAGSPITLAANASGGDPDVTPTYNWAVSAGAIESGQGTSSITIDTSGLDPDSTVTTTVDLGGYAPACSVTSSCTTTVTKKSA